MDTFELQDFNKRIRLNTDLKIYQIKYVKNII